MKKGYSDKTISKNISAEMKKGHSQKQAIAMAMSEANKARKKAGLPEMKPKKKK